MKVFLFTLIYLLIGYVITVIDLVVYKMRGTRCEYTAGDTLLVCLFWAVILPLFFIFVLFDKLKDANNIMSTKICKWIKAKNERRFD